MRSAGNTKTFEELTVSKPTRPICNTKKEDCPSCRLYDEVMSLKAKAVENGLDESQVIETLLQVVKFSIQEDRGGVVLGVKILYAPDSSTQPEMTAPPSAQLH